MSNDHRLMCERLGHPILMGEISMVSNDKRLNHLLIASDIFMTTCWINAKNHTSYNLIYFRMTAPTISKNF